MVHLAFGSCLRAAKLLVLASGAQPSFVAGASMCVEAESMDPSIVGAAVTVKGGSPGGSQRPPGKPLMACDTCFRVFDQNSI